MTTNDQMRHVYETWHRAIVDRDLDKLTALYANESVVDSSAVLVVEKDPSGIIRGRDCIRKHFARFFAILGESDGEDSYRLQQFFGTQSRWSGNTRARGPMETSSMSLSRWVWKTS
jgi:ketosteroid isomerase-like protein